MVIITAEKMVEIFTSLEDIFKTEPIIIEDDSKKIMFVGDIHGDTETLNYVEERIEQFDRIVFLGDYIDRGVDDIVASYRIAELKLENKRVILLTGNHDCEEVWPRDWIDRLNSTFEFDEAKKISRAYLRAFQNAPIAYLNKHYGLLAVHGFIPKDKHNIKEWEKAENEVIWNDPNIIGGEFQDEDSENKRGWGIYTIGKKTVLAFMNQNNLKRIVRSHQPKINKQYELGLGNEVINLGSSGYYKTRGFYVLPDDKIVMEYP